VTTFSGYDYISQMRSGIRWIWFTPVRSVTMVTYILIQETPCNFSCPKMLIMRDMYLVLRGEIRTRGVRIELRHPVNVLRLYSSLPDLRDATINETDEVTGFEKMCIYDLLVIFVFSLFYD